MAGLALLARQQIQQRRLELEPGWGWLLGCCISGWLFTSLSPNKDGRYIAPVLALLALLLARGWWELGLWIERRSGARWAALQIGRAHV